MKKAMKLDFARCAFNGLDLEQRRRAVVHEFVDSYKRIGESIVRRIYKGSKEPKKMIIVLEIKRGIPLRRRVRVTIGDFSRDKLKKCYRDMVIRKMFLDAWTAIGQFCLENLCQRKRLPKQIEVMLDIR